MGDTCNRHDLIKHKQSRAYACSVKVALVPRKNSSSCRRVASSAYPKFYRVAYTSILWTDLSEKAAATLTSPAGARRRLQISECSR